MKIEDIISLHNDMYNDNKKIIVLITMEADDNNEQSIFDTINRAGVRLSVADIIKNDLFKKCLDCHEGDSDKEKEVIDIYEKKWASVFYYPVNASDWDETRVFGNQTRTNLEFLLYCVAFVNWGKRDDIFSDLANLYKKETDRMSYDELIGLVNQIKDYADVFRKEILDLQKNYKNEETPMTFSFNDTKRRVLLILEVLGVQMFYPYVLKLLIDETDADAPFSNVDEIHIDNICRILPHTANQVIMAVMQKDWEYASQNLGKFVGKSYTITKDRALIILVRGYMEDKVYHLIGPDGKPYESTEPGTLGGHKGLKIYGRLDCPNALRHIGNGKYKISGVFQR